MKTDENNTTNSAENAEINRREKVKNDLEKETARNEGMRKGAVTASVIALIILLVGAIFVFSHNKSEHNKLLNLMDTQKMALTEKVTARDSVISEWITAFDDIQKNILLIKEKEKLITVNSSAEMSNDKKRQVLEDIKTINTLIEQNKKKIASLNAQLSKSGGTIKILQTKISELETTMKQNESEISELKTSLVSKNFEAEQLNTQIIVMKDTITKKDERISTQTFEMNKAFYICGTYKELKAKGLLTKEGGFIGLGKTKSLTGNFSDNSFEQIDLTQTKVIPINSKSAKLISDHPTGSYEFIRDKDKNIESILIKDPVLFWKASKYAVIEITK